MAELDQPVVYSPKNNLPPKVLSGFLYKAILFAVFVALLPLFPSQFTEPGNHTILSRSWELLHLLLVGIAVSYGLFSRRNADADLEKDKDPNSKADTPQSYVSRMLQVSPVFDDYTEAGAAVVSADEGKLETWSSQFQAADPLVVVANGNGRTGKPLLLPVRSLKNSRVQNSDGLTESSVLPSPIPWRSRSGRSEAGDEAPAINSSRNPSLHSPPAPPPPPPPSFTHGSLFVEKRQVKKSFKDELKDMSQKGRDGFLRSSHLVTEQMKPENPSSPRSVRTVRSKEAQSAERDPFMKTYQAETKAKKKKKKTSISDDSNSDDTINDASDDDEPSKRAAEARAALQKNEVDKKADAFIAKFREQIRLQRIESIKKSSGHKSLKNSD
ncbi:hypothetical protein HPP92_025401 [Vanilla planifolia]|uniref:Uncharacterized protein n=1 Tax=Vanilla planifolia TaxID=51239 RepID=A0A835UBA0_VANPL|nr:hypothetical protein HPP92_025690 [Vanilla planifolia]KAG0454097.1 hypothetical protein HPP92_025401 [Vanilla planifolia]